MANFLEGSKHPKYDGKYFPLSYVSRICSICMYLRYITTMDWVWPIPLWPMGHTFAHLNSFRRGFYCYVWMVLCLSAISWNCYWSFFPKNFVILSRNSIKLKFFNILHTKRIFSFFCTICIIHSRLKP